MKEIITTVADLNAALDGLEPDTPIYIDGSDDDAYIEGVEYHGGNVFIRALRRPAAAPRANVR